MVQGEGNEEPIVRADENAIPNMIYMQRLLYFKRDSSKGALVLDWYHQDNPLHTKYDTILII